MKADTLKKWLENPWRIAISFARRGWLDVLSDKAYLSVMYRAKLNKKINWKEPKTFNEKLQWLKLHNRKDIHTVMADKVAVKSYLAEIIGEEFIIKTYGVWERFEDIDFNTLPDQFVLKCNHDSGSVLVCTEKAALDLEKTKAIFTRGLKSNAYDYGREWPYKNIVPKIFAEELIRDEDHGVLPVYKFFCFHGKPRLIQTIQNDKQPNESVDYFDLEWNRLDIRQDFPNSAVPFAKPDQLPKMIQLAEKLSKEEPFLRVDFYAVKGNVYFSEFTFFTDSGFGQFYPEKWDVILGSWI